MNVAAGRNTCFIACCVVSVIVALFVIFAIIQPVNFFTGLMLFLIIVTLLMLVPAILLWPFGGSDDEARGPSSTEIAAAEAARTAPAAPIADPAPAAPAPTPAPAPAAAPKAAAEVDHGTVGQGAAEGGKPGTLTAPRDGKADNLKEIKGVGPKLEQMLNGMGFYHFDQIAGWTADEVDWVNANLEGLSGRVSRDNWVEQAKLLAAGGETEFSKRVGDGDVY